MTWIPFRQEDEVSGIPTKGVRIDPLVVFSRLEKPRCSISLKESRMYYIVLVVCVFACVCVCVCVCDVCVERKKKKEIREGAEYIVPIEVDCTSKLHIESLNSKTAIKKHWSPKRERVRLFVCFSDCVFQPSDPPLQFEKKGFDDRHLARM